MKQKLEILLLEDDPNDAHFIQSFLQLGGLIFRMTTVSNREDYLNELDEEKYDVVISDHQLPKFSAADALAHRNEKAPRVPFIILTGALSDVQAAGLLQEGANDYILKDRLQRLPAAVKMAVEKQRIRNLQAEATLALRKSNERFELAMKASFDLIWDYDASSGKVFCNEMLEKKYGYATEIINDPQKISECIYPSDRRLVEDSFRSLLSGTETRWQMPFRLVKSTGEVLHVHASALVSRRQDNSIERITGVVQDVSGIVQLQRELSRHKFIRQKEINETTLEAQEKEREEIGKELHDNVNQLLATAKIMIDAAIRSPDMHDELLRISQESILSAIREIRNISHSMMPPSLQGKRFIEALSDIAERISLAGAVQLGLELPPVKDLNRVDEKIKLTLYRIIQEQVTNILKYAQAEHASIKISIEEDYIRLTIADNGIGFDPAESTKGIGLKNIRSRTEMLDGIMELNAKPNGGVKMTVTIPLVVMEEYEERESSY